MGTEGKALNTERQAPLMPSSPTYPTFTTQQVETLYERWSEDTVIALDLWTNQTRVATRSEVNNWNAHSEEVCNFLVLTDCTELEDLFPRPQVQTLDNVQIQAARQGILFILKEAMATAS